MKKVIVMRFILLCFFLPVQMVFANNIQVSNIRLTGQNKTNDYTMVEFNLAWENSWRNSSAPGNFDAAWVFVKYRVSGGAWQHAWLNNDGHSSGSGTGADMIPGLLTPANVFHTTNNPALGVFISRSADGSGAFSITGARLRWNYGANGIADDATVEVKVFAVEMVIVPEGAFYVGTGGTEQGSFTNGSWTSGATIPLQITSENALTIGQSAGYLWGTSNSGDNSIGGAGTLPAEFPKGYGAFFSMKYEISQQQYVDFLNMLTATQAGNRFSAGSTGNRYGITVSSGVYSTTKPYVACNFLSWADGAAYADWTGLRPMTELEYEKACRGTLAGVANEYVWGSASGTAANNITGDGTSNETTSTSGANFVAANQSNVQGPMRVGVFATGTTSRTQSGAGYWGIMELSGNLLERTVAVGNLQGRTYTGIHGNGQLSTNGNGDVTAWPGLVSGEITDAMGAGFRGGDWYNAITSCRVADRYQAGTDYNGRLGNSGFRAVRSVPFTCGISVLTILHTTSDGVAPVDKTVTYGTVTNIPGETSKCWINKNLGADIQADSVNAMAMTKAGWFWQFNRKQGYKHDAWMATTPAWQTSGINENSDWLANNDPCNLELGTGWRLPTVTEWTNVDATSGSNWTTWNDPWNSRLKLHAAGYLEYHTTYLFCEWKSRGFEGQYWSGTQQDNNSAHSLDFWNTASQVVWSYKTSGNTIRCIRIPLPVVTTEAVSSVTSVSATCGGNISWEGNAAVTARGVCWSTSQNPTTALTTKTTDGTGSGSFVSSISGLTGGTTYYVRAYATSTAGTAYGNQVSFTTPVPFTCGTSTLTISHTTSGGVAPVAKSVTYSTVTNIPGETSKCWITSNLGSDHQATAVSDATEASAGWCWQFNRKQGYKHDGSSRTPNTTWITSITESSDWLATNDPCALELGSSWRIPTSSELNNISGSNGGSWSNWNGPWNSGLKMHSSGFLNLSGTLVYRGASGIFWSGTQDGIGSAFRLAFNSSAFLFASTDKTMGFSVRCIKE